MKVSLISLNMNGMQFLDAFLESVRLELDGYPDAELILLDNGSADDSVSHVMNEHPWVRLIRSERNLGFASGCHKAAIESKADFLIFVNNDMELKPGFIEAILKPFDEKDNVGAVGGLILNDTGTRIDFAGGDANLFGWGFQRHHGEPASVIEDLDIGRLEAHTTKGFFPCGGAVAIRRDTWEKSGGFDPGYFAFFEDVDLGWRLNLMGYRIAHASKAQVLHRHHGTAVAMPSNLRTYLLERNALISVLKNYDDANLARILPWAVAIANERGLIEVGAEISDTFRGRWFEDIWGNPIEDDDSKNQKETTKRSALDKAKQIIKKQTGGSKQSVRQLAVSEVFAKWDSIMMRRVRVQKMRKLTDNEVIERLGEKYRTVLGHPREKYLMETFKNNVQI